MNCAEANKILITDFLYSNGIEPVRVVGNSYWYLSPLREEKAPSFKVDASINKWYDHGMAIGGKLVDLGVRLHQISVAEFLDKISGQSFFHSFSFQKPIAKATSPIIKTVKEIESEALISYLEFRAIDLDIARHFCKEVHFTANSKNYYGIGFENDRGGFEIRSKHFKGNIGGKWLTTLKDDAYDEIILFEGFFDFMTAYQRGGFVTCSTCVVLNSVSQIGNAISMLKESKADDIYAFFDNDNAGRNCFQKLKAAFPSAVDRSCVYEECKDFNEMVMQTKSKHHG
jgi:5S rRNA maturation endonuclease (ribonuclease M5)